MQQPWSDFKFQVMMVKLPAASTELHVICVRAEMRPNQRGFTMLTSRSFRVLRKLTAVHMHVNRRLARWKK